MSNFFQNAQNQGFWNHDFWFLSRGKKATWKLLFIWMQAMNEWKNERINLSPHPILGVTTKYVCYITTMRFIGCWKKWWIIELKSASKSPSDRKNVALYTVTI